MKTRKGYNLRPLGNEFILIPEGHDAVDFSHMISMNETAALLWRELEGKDFDLATMAHLLMENYDITQDVAEKDVAALLQSWKQSNIIDE